MADKRAPGRSLDEWMVLVTKCRQSGLTDATWCTEHGISPPKMPLDRIGDEELAALDGSLSHSGHR